MKKKDVAELPLHIKDLLLGEIFYEAYQARPFYQRNDYIHWIMGAKREDPAQKRLAQMIKELRAGNLYMTCYTRNKRRYRKEKQGLLI